MAWVVSATQPWLKIVRLHQLVGLNVGVYSCLLNTQPPPPPKVSCLILQYSGPCCIKVRKKWAGLCNIMYIGKLGKIIVLTHEASCTCAYDGGLTVEVDGQG